MGANAGEPNNVEQQKAITKESLEWMIKISSAGKIVSLNHEYVAKI